MIYGSIKSYSDHQKDQNLESIKNLMMWPDCVHHPLSYGGFSGGLFFDKNLPQRIENFVYLNHETETMVLASGVLYNQKEIAKKLVPNNLSIKLAELIYVAFLNQGSHFVNEFNGDFSIFIYQKKDNSFYLYRDHIGILPLYYYVLGEDYYFSSDSLSLGKSMNQKKIDRDFMINGVISLGLNLTSLLADVFKSPSKNLIRILPGHYIKKNKGELSNCKYWYPEKIKEDKTINYNTLMSSIKPLVDDAVKIRTDKKYNTATHLSGGLDSSYIASKVKEEYNHQKDFFGFCWTPDKNSIEDFEFDEIEMVKRLGKHLKITPVFTNLEVSEYINYLSDWRVSLNELYELKVRENAKLKDVNLIFSGWGGDHFISIYNWGIDSDLFFKMQWRSFLKRNPINKPKSLIAKLLYNVFLPALHLKNFTIVRPLDKYSRFIKKNTQYKVRTIDEISNWRSRKDLHKLYLNFDISMRTEEWYILGAKMGIEYRYPLLDKRIIEFMFKVPSKALAHNPKFERIILREISIDLLPEEIRWHTSKNDPIRGEALTELQNKVAIELIKEVPDFSNNPDLDFIDFEVLKDDIKSFQNGSQTLLSDEIIYMLLSLKKLHSFTKAYLN